MFIGLVSLIVIATFFGWSRHAELNRFNKIITQLEINPEDVI